MTRSFSLVCWRATFLGGERCGGSRCRRWYFPIRRLLKKGSRTKTSFAVSPREKEFCTMFSKPFLGGNFGLFSGMEWVGRGFLSVDWLCKLCFELCFNLWGRLVHESLRYGVQATAPTRQPQYLPAFAKRECVLHVHSDIHCLLQCDPSRLIGDKQLSPNPLAWSW